MCGRGAVVSVSFRGVPPPPAGCCVVLGWRRLCVRGVGARLSVSRPTHRPPVLRAPCGFCDLVRAAGGCPMSCCLPCPLAPPAPLRARSPRRQPAETSALSMRRAGGLGRQLLYSYRRGAVVRSLSAPCAPFGGTWLPCARPMRVCQQARACQPALCRQPRASLFAPPAPLLLGSPPHPSWKAQARPRVCHSDSVPTLSNVKSVKLS